jgi:RNA polymerase sigma-70 factor (ECF subfamily)
MAGMKRRQNSDCLSGVASTGAVSFLQQDPAGERDRRWAGWIARMSHGDMEALSAFYDETSKVIFGLVRDILPDRDAAEDALVEIYDQARRRAASFDPRRNAPLEWLIHLARNLAVHRLRHLPSSRITLSVEAFRRERLIAALAVARLSDDERSILEMTYLEGLTADEVARVMNVSREQVAAQVVSAMKQLRSASEHTAMRSRFEFQVLAEGV